MFLSHSVFVLCLGSNVSGSYAAALEHKTGPSVLALSRQNVPNLATSSIANVKLGAYTVFETAPGAAPELVRGNDILRNDILSSAVSLFKGVSVWVLGGLEFVSCIRLVVR